mmetsp:Transcript_134434/g.190051  ORF Transcript_134434/g.190051 Transcript_134434/m.190051 type:complete len:80 (-) Transcript_134434:346-585(-)
MTVLATTTLNPSLVAARSREEVVNAQLEIINVVPEELLTAAPGLTPPTVPQLGTALCGAIVAIVPDPPNLGLHAHARHT